MHSTEQIAIFVFGVFVAILLMYFGPGFRHMTTKLYHWLSVVARHFSDWSMDTSLANEDGARSFDARRARRKAVRKRVDASERKIASLTLVQGN